MTVRRPRRDDATEIRAWAEEEYSRLLDLYADLHAHPELSGREERTAALLAREMRAIGCEVTEGIGGHGIVGVFANGPGPVVMLRAELDALPIEEKTGLPYASKAMYRAPNGLLVGVSHACGHDLHMAVMAGAAAALVHHHDAWNGTLVCVGQPAEETASGAAAMLAAGLYERFPRPDYALALHVGPHIPLGSIGYQARIVSAGSQSLDLVVRGRGGHAAYPDLAKDPVVLAAEIVLAFQTIRSREIAPLQFGIVTVGAIHGGFKHNAIPDEVLLRVNIRFFDEPVRTQILASIRRIADGLAASAGLPPDLYPVLRTISEGAPPLENDPAAMERVAAALRATLGREKVVEIQPLTGSEDFGRFRDGDPPVALCYLRLGVDPPDTEHDNLPYLHSPRFAPPPEAITIGVTAMTASAIELFESTMRSADGDGRTA